MLKMREVRLGRLSSLFVMNSAEIGNQISLSLEILFFITAYVATKEGSDGKESTCYAEDLGSIPGWGRSPGEGNGNPLQYSCLEDPMDRGAWWATVYGVAKSWTRLSDKHTHTHTHTHIYRDVLKDYIPYLMNQSLTKTLGILVLISHLVQKPWLLLTSYILWTLPLTAPTARPPGFMP